MSAELQKTEKSRIGVYDPYPLRLEGLLSLFADHPAYEFLRADLPSLVGSPSLSMAIIGLHGPFDALAVVGAVRAVRPSCRILLMGPAADEEHLLAMVSAGAKGYIEDTALPEQVEQAIDIVRSGSIWVPRRVLAMFVERANQKSRPGLNERGDFHLTPREREVLRGLVAARSNPEIAQTLGIEERTVKMHVGRLMHKAGVENRVALTTFALARGIISGEQETEEHQR